MKLVKGSIQAKIDLEKLDLFFSEIGKRDWATIKNPLFTKARLSDGSIFVRVSMASSELKAVFTESQVNYSVVDRYGGDLRTPKRAKIWGANVVGKWLDQVGMIRMVHEKKGKRA